MTSFIWLNAFTSLLSNIFSVWFVRAHCGRTYTREKQKLAERCRRSIECGNWNGEATSLSRHYVHLTNELKRALFEPTSYQWHCKQFLFLLFFFAMRFVFLFVCLLVGCCICSMASLYTHYSDVAILCVARFNKDFKVRTRRHMNVNGCGFNHCYPVKCIPKLLHDSHW